MKEKLLLQIRPEKWARSKLWSAGGLLLAFIGVNLILLTHIFILNIIGGLLIIFGLLMSALFLKKSGISERALFRQKNLAEKFIYIISVKGYLIKWLPIIGMGAIALVIGYNVFGASNRELQTVDWIIIALSTMLILYPFIPDRFRIEKEFALVFVFFALLLFSILFLVPVAIGYYSSGSLELPADFVYWLLAAPTCAIVNLTGAYARPMGDIITYQEANGNFQNLKIATTCSGIDSLILFISGFIAFILVENVKFNKRIVVAFIGGIVTAYLANILRMVIVVLTGIYHGRSTMLWVHDNIGIWIFLGWIALFWYFMYKFILRPGKDFKKTI